MPITWTVQVARAKDMKSRAAVTSERFATKREALAYIGALRVAHVRKVAPQTYTVYEKSR